jgi:sarcosine oxidase / L-pipecolate oxidase
MRAAYGSLKAYQDFGLEALEQWRSWNTEIKSGSILPPGFNKDDIIFVNNGSLELNSKDKLTQYQLDSMANMAKSGFGDSQVNLMDHEQVSQAIRAGFGHAINPFNRHLAKNFGTLDTMAGFVYADRACRFALHKAQSLGVKTLLGSPQGVFRSFVYDSNSKVTGIKTADDCSRPASLVVLACGGWTPSLLRQMDNLCETTAGSVCIFQLPKDAPDLWARFAPENFPTWA